MTLEEVRAVFLDYESRKSQMRLLAAELVSIKNDLELFRSLPTDNVPVVHPDASELFRLVADTFPLIDGDAEFVDLLLSLRSWVKGMAGEEEQWLARIAAQKETDRENWLLYRHNMSTRAVKGLRLADKALKVLGDRYSVVNPLLYTMPMSESMAKLVMDVAEGDQLTGK